jgi:hypothetical protein
LIQPSQSISLSAKLSTNFLHRIDSASSLHNLNKKKKPLNRIDSEESLTNQIQPYNSDPNDTITNKKRGAALTAA